MEALRNSRAEFGKMPENILISRILSGEKELFEILLRRYNQTLYRVIRGYLNNDDDIMDTMQDAYLKAFDKLAQFQGSAAFSTWLIRIGINEALLRLRKQKRNSTLSMDNSNNAEKYFLQFPDPNKMNPEKITIGREMLALIEKAIDQLPEKYKLIYILKEVEGLDHSAIAACLDISDNNVKVRLHRAKDMLKNALFEISANNISLFEFGNKRCDKIIDFVMGNI